MNKEPDLYLGWEKEDFIARIKELEAIEAELIEIKARRKNAGRTPKKTTPELVEEIRAAKDGGSSFRAIAAELDISRSLAHKLYRENFEKRPQNDIGQDMSVKGVSVIKMVDAHKCPYCGTVASAVEDWGFECEECTRKIYNEGDTDDEAEPPTDIGAADPEADGDEADEEESQVYLILNALKRGLRCNRKIYKPKPGEKLHRIYVNDTETFLTDSEVKTLLNMGFEHKGAGV